MAALLNYRNIYPFTLVAHAVHMKECYENVQVLIKSTDCDKYSWNVCGDLKVTPLLLGMQLGFTKHCNVLCEWDSQTEDRYYIVQEWLVRV
jgi:hypothetical protein